MSNGYESRQQRKPIPLKITDIKPYAVCVGHRNQMLVKIETDEGIYGWGESGFSGRELGVKGIMEHYREFLIGKDPMSRGGLWQEMSRNVRRRLMMISGPPDLTETIIPNNLRAMERVREKILNEVGRCGRR